MEQTELIEKELVDIYKILMDSDKKSAQPVFDNLATCHPQTWSLSLRYIISPMIIYLFIAAIANLLYYIDFIQIETCILMTLVAKIIFLIGYTAIVPVSLLNSFSQFKELYSDRKLLFQILKNPIILIFEGLLETSKKDVSILHELNKFSLESLEISKLNIEERRKSILHRLNTLIGAFDKVGIIPGMVSLYLAVFSDKFQKTAIIAAVVMVAFYLVAFAIHFSIPRLDFYIQLIDITIKRKEKSSK